MSEKPTREECAEDLDVCAERHGRAHVYAAAYLREDGARIAELEGVRVADGQAMRVLGEAVEKLTQERDAANKRAEDAEDALCQLLDAQE